MFILYIFGPIFVLFLILHLIKKTFGMPGEIFVNGLGWIALITILIVLFTTVSFFSLKKLVPFDPSFKEPLAFIENLIDKFPIKSPFSGLNPGNETVPNNSNNSKDSKDSESSEDSENKTEMSLEELAEMEDNLKNDVSKILSEDENKDMVVINRNFSFYLKDFGSKTKSNKEDFEKNFFSMYSNKFEFNHITSVETEYNNIDFTLKLKEKKGKLICTIEFTNANNFNGTFKQKEDKYISGPIDESKKQSSIHNSIYELFLHIPKGEAFDSMFNEHSNREERDVAKVLKQLGDPIVDNKKELILKELATNSCFSDIYTVNLNDKIYLKKDGIVKRSFTTDEIESIFGSTKKKEKNVVKKANGRNYVAITSTLCYNSSSTTSAIELIQIAENINLDGLIYSQVNEDARATAQNGKTYFELFDQIKNEKNY